MPYQIEIRKKPFTSSCLKKLQFPSHIHPHLELIYLKKGTSIVTTDNKKYCLSDGDLLLIFPNQIHSYRDETSIDAPADQDCIKRLLIYCTDHYTEPISLELLAKELHLNKYYISHIFQEI